VRCTRRTPPIVAWYALRALDTLALEGEIVEARKAQLPRGSAVERRVRVAATLVEAVLEEWLLRGWREVPAPTTRGAALLVIVREALRARRLATGLGETHACGAVCERVEASAVVPARVRSER
jgi:hypothetical protein